MEKQEITEEDLIELASAMAQKLPELDCPDCCDCGWRYQYIERSAQLYREEYEWACLTCALLYYRSEKKPRHIDGQ